jgi:hypothetical protein
MPAGSTAEFPRNALGRGRHDGKEAPEGAGNRHPPVQPGIWRGWCRRILHYWLMTDKATYGLLVYLTPDGLIADYGIVED